MKALTICQPYAHLILIGEKFVENRTWPTKHRGALAIHAGKSEDWLNEHDRKKYPGMAFGAVIAIADVVDCISYNMLPRLGTAEAKKILDHPHTNGPWCWILENVRPMTPPIECKGARMLWEFNL